MAFQLYNTLSRQVEDFEPMDRLIAWLERARSNPLAPLYFLALFV